MKPLLRKETLLILIVFAFQSILTLEGAEYYVSVNGKNDNPGTIALPFRTIQKAADAMESGDICYIRGGIYREEVMVNKDNLTFTNYGNAYVLITRTEPVENWSAYQHQGNTIYVADISSKVHEVFVNGHWIRPATHPDRPGEDMTDLLDWETWGAKVNVDDAANVTFKQMDIPSGHFDGGIFNGISGAGWCTYQAKIISTDNNTLHCSDPDHRDKQMTGFWSSSEGKGYISHHINALDTANEWYWGDKKLYLWAPGDAHPNTLNVEARTDKWGFILNNRSNIRLSGLHFKAAGLQMDGASNCTVEDCSFRYCSYFLNTNLKKSWRNADIGIQLGGNSNTIQHCYIMKNWGIAVHLKGSSHLIDNCIIKYAAIQGTFNSSNIESEDDCKDITLSNSTIAYTPRAVMRQFGVKDGTATALNNQIIHNDFHHGMMLTRDGGIFYTSHTDGGGTRIAFNHFHDAPGVSIPTSYYAKPVIAGIYFDSSTDDYEVYYNCIWNIGRYNNPEINEGDCGIRLNGIKKFAAEPCYSQNFEIYNNSITRVKSAITHWFRKKDHNCTYPHMKDVKTYNNLSNRTSQELMKDRTNKHPEFVGTDVQHNLHDEDPGWVNPQKGNLQLKSGSPAIDHGKFIPGISDQYPGGIKGENPDAGCYEYGGVIWEPGSTLPDPYFPDEAGLIP